MKEMPVGASATPGGVFPTASGKLICGTVSKKKFEDSRGHPLRAEIRDESSPSPTGAGLEDLACR